MDKESLSEQKSVECVDEISAHLGHPAFVRVNGDPCDVNSSCFELDDEQDQVPDEALEGHEFDREEVGSRHHLPMGCQEGFPLHPFTAFWGGFQSMSEKDPFDRRSGHVAAQVTQGSGDPRIAPSGVLACHPDNLISDDFGFRGAAKASTFRSVVFPDDELSIPAEQRFRGDEGGDVTKAPAGKSAGFGRQQSSLGVCKPQTPWAQMFPQDAVFLPKVIDDILLLPIDPTGERYEDELPGDGCHGPMLAQMRPDDFWYTTPQGD